MVEPIPAGYPRVSAYLCVDGAAEAIAFYSEVFGATERSRLPMEDGRLGHAEIQIGDSVVMLSDAYPEWGNVSPKTLGGTPIIMNVYVEDVDAVFAQALALGATEHQAIETYFYGDRSGQFLDPFGHRWNVSTHVEDVSPEEMERRSKEWQSS